MPTCKERNLLNIFKLPDRALHTLSRVNFFNRTVTRCVIHRRRFPPRVAFSHAVSVPGTWKEEGQWLMSPYLQVLVFLPEQPDPTVSRCCQGSECLIQRRCVFPLAKREFEWTSNLKRLKKMERFFRNMVLLLFSFEPSGKRKRIKSCLLIRQWGWQSRWRGESIFHDC